MKLSDGMRKYKRIVAAVIIILLVVFVEVGFNYPALVEGYEELDLSPYIKAEGEKGNQSYVVEYQVPQGLYVKQLEIRGRFSGANCIVECRILNDFGKEEEYTVTDSVHSWFTSFYTNLNKRITSIKITLPKYSGTELWSVSLSNRAEINKYRLLFVALSLMVLYCVFFEHIFRKRPEYFFLLFSAAYGVLLLLSGQPQCNAWDEQAHFQNAYRLASGRVVEWNEAAELMGTGKTVKCNTKAEYAQLREFMDEKGKNGTAAEEQGRWGLGYNSFGYLPSAVFLRIGMWLGLSFSNLILLGRMGNLLAYILAMFWAIRLAKQKKLFLLFISLMPTSLFLACSYTYDGTTFSFVTLGIVLWANEKTVQKKEHWIWPSVLSVFLIIIGGMAKIVYVPLAVIWILEPRIKRISKKKKALLLSGAAVFCAVLGIFVVVRWLIPVLNGQILFADSRGGETSLAAQLTSMLHHPWASVKMFVRDILSLDNFRNSGIAEYNDFFVGNLMFLNYYLMGVMSDKWCILLLPVMVILLLYPGEEIGEQRVLRRGQQCFILLIVTGVIGLIWASMYLAFTPVGDSRIAGVQARYYLPLVYLAALAIQGKTIVIQAGYKGMVKMTMVTALVLETVSMYDFILSSRLF